MCVQPKGKDPGLLSREVSYPCEPKRILHFPFTQQVDHKNTGKNDVLKTKWSILGVY